MEMTRIVYLDMLQQFPIPQSDKDDQEGHIHFQQDSALPHYLEEVCEYLKPVSQFGRLVGADNMATSFLGSYTPGFFSYGDSLKIECSYNLYLQRYWLQVGRLPHYQWKSHHVVH
jgi:hypothetical protein